MLFNTCRWWRGQDFNLGQGGCAERRASVRVDFSLRLPSGRGCSELQTVATDGNRLANGSVFGPCAADMGIAAGSIRRTDLHGSIFAPDVEFAGRDQDISLGHRIVVTIFGLVDDGSRPQRSERLYTPRAIQPRGGGADGSVGYSHCRHGTRWMTGMAVRPPFVLDDCVTCDTRSAIRTARCRCCSFISAKNWSALTSATSFLTSRERPPEISLDVPRLWAAHDAVRRHQ